MTLLVSKIKIFSLSIGFKSTTNFARLLLFALVGTITVAAQNSPSGSDVFPVPDTYKTEGIPPIKKSEVENLFYDPASIRSNLIWDADGKNRRLLVTDEKNTVYSLDSPLGAPVELFNKRVPNSLKVRPSGSGSEDGFAFTDDHEDEDNYQLYLYNFKDKAIKKVTTLTGKDESIESFVWDKTGKFLHYTRVDYETKTSRLCQNDLSAEKCFPAELKGIWSVLDADTDKILLKHWKASSSQLLYVYDRAANKLAPVDEQGNSRKAALFGETVFWLTEGNDACGEQTACVLSFSLKKGAVQKLNLPENLADFNDVKFSPTGAKLLVQETRNGVDLLRVFRLKNGKVAKELPSFVSGSYVIWNTRWMTDEEIVFTLENNGKPASVHSFNLETKKFTDWTKERLPAQLEGKVKPPEIIRWHSFDGREISGYAVRPAVVQRKSPVLIFLHGGPQVLDKPVFNVGDIRLAANLGLTIIHTNIRGSSGFGKEFMDADNAGKRGDAVKDVQALLDWIGKQPGLDASKIYLRGQSYGGFVALSTAMQEPTRVKAVIAEYPLVSIRDFLSQNWIDEFARSEYGDPKDEVLMSKLDVLSPLNNASWWNSRVPVFLTRGKLDQRSPEKSVVDLKNQLQTRGAEVWFIYSNEDGHGFSGKYLTAAMFQFLKKQTNKEQ